MKQLEDEARGWARGRGRPRYKGLRLCFCTTAALVLLAGGARTGIIPADLGTRWGQVRVAAYGGRKLQKLVHSPVSDYFALIQEELVCETHGFRHGRNRLVALLGVKGPFDQL